MLLQHMIDLFPIDHPCNISVTLSCSLCVLLIWPEDGGTAQGGGTE